MTDEKLHEVNVWGRGNTNRLIGGQGHLTPVRSAALNRISLIATGLASASAHIFMSWIGTDQMPCEA